MELLELAVDVARAAGALLLDRFGRAHEGVGTKSSATDMVSDADRAAEAFILGAIGCARPDDGFLAEEGGATRTRSGVTWVIDPLDGTTNFLYGIPQWCVSIAATEAGGTVAGAVFDPVRDEMFAAARGSAATLNGTTIRTRAETDLARALVATGFSYDAGERAIAGRMMAGIVPRVRDVRRAGSAALDLCFVACGRLDGYYEAPSHPWDLAAGELIVREAGGRTEVMEQIGPGGPGLIAGAAGIFDALRALVIEVHPATSISRDG
ncbi:MAG: inositol monophosphatase family protein [Actinomycetota bacterium]